MQRSRVRRVGALVLGLALVAAACGDDDDDDAATDTEAPADDRRCRHHGRRGHRHHGRRGTETTTAGTAGAETTTAGTGEPGPAGALAGMKGTTPLPPELSQEFIDALETTPTGEAGLTDLNYAAESYDAVTLIALAVEAAGTDGSAHAGGDRQRLPRG